MSPRDRKPLQLKAGMGRPHLQDSIPCSTEYGKTVGQGKVVDPFTPQFPCEIEIILLSEDCEEKMS